MTTITFDKLETFKQVDNTYVFCVQNPTFELKNAAGLYKRVLILLKDESLEKIVLDLQNVVSMNTSGIGALLSIHHACSRSDIDFVICNINPDVEDLLHTTQVLDVLQSVEDEQQALNL